MKNMYTAAVTCLLLAVLPSTLFAQKSIRGNGIVTTQNRSVEPFTKIKINGVFDVIINQGNEETVVVLTDDNLQSLVTVEVTNGTLCVGLKLKSNFKEYTKMNILITLKSINELTNSLVGNLSNTGTLNLPQLTYTSSAVGNAMLNVQCNTLILKLKAVGDTNLTGTAKQCTITNSSVGNVNASKLIATTLTLQNTAVGNTTINAATLTHTNHAVGNVLNVYYAGK